MDLDNPRCKGRAGVNTSRGRHNRARASNFRKCTEFKRVIELVDVDGNRRRVVSRGRMNGVKHKTVLQVLTQLAQQFRSRLGRPGPKGSSHAWAIDEMGTLEASGLGMCESEAVQLENSEVNKITVPEEVFQVHGFAPPKKAEGTVRLIYENVNGFSNRLCGNEKVERVQQIHNKLEVDMAANCEHQLNMHHKKNVNGFNQLFKGGGSCGSVGGGSQCT
jgi:hypothetical protein